MKKVLRNNLWLMMIAWSMFLNGYSLLGGLISITASLILFMNIKSLKIGRILLIAGGYLLLGVVFTIFSSVNSFNNFPFFCSVVSINAALFNEKLYKERINTLMHLAIVMLLCFIIFIFVAMLLPSCIIFETARINMFYLITLIFIPYTSEVLLAFIIKNSRRNKKVIKIKESSIYNNKIAS